MRNDNGSAIPDLVDKPCGKAVDNQLDEKVQRDQKRNFRQRNRIAVLKGDEEQGDKIVDNSLYNVPDKARINGFLIILIQSGASSLCEMVDLFLGIFARIWWND